MEYWVYENWNHGRVLAHIRNCHDCKPSSDNPHWHGPLDDVRKTEFVTLALGKFMRSFPGYSGAAVRWCRQCISRVPETRLTREHHFDLIVVDVAALRVADEFDRRDGD